MGEPSTPGCEMCENGEPCIHCLGERCDRYREALLALVEASEEWFRPNSLGAPLWPRTVDARKVLDA